ncbi:MAG: hypothetical protein JW910_05895 [Anaerolineae bacterium]|nr:hypothetical protein [Anaerolineae bacterium]
MSKQYTLYVVPHTHWDREWYGSFQVFRTRLVRLLNKLLAILDRDPAYRTFHLDGQTVVLEDYLEVHPEQRAALQRYIAAGRLMAGPWYILPDEFLSSGESLVRNLLLGGQVAREFGGRLDVGYIPDTFGHIAQLPQILRGFGLDSAMHFRGLDPDGLPSELWWQAPDGSRVLLHHMSNLIGYSDLGAWASDPDRAALDLRAVAYYKAERATSNVLLAMQGVDHAEARADLPAIVQRANDLCDDIEFVHASLADYWAALKAATAGLDLQTVSGELRDVPRSEGGKNFLLYNVLSSRVDNKLHNAITLNALERWAEPWCALAWAWDVDAYPRGHLWTAWRWLLKNHPHDSIGGCSVDAVHRQMATRFEWAQEIADALAEERFRLLADDLDVGGALGEDELALVLFNATPWERDEVVTVEIDLPEHWLQQRALAGVQPALPLTPDSPYADVLAANIRADWGRGAPTLPEVFFRSLHVRPLHGRALDGEAIPVEIERVAPVTVALALASGPRGVMDARRARVSFRAHIPAYGYATYAVRTDPQPVKWPAPELPPGELRNEFLAVRVQPNGTFDLTDRATGQTFSGLGLFEDGGDNGDGYTFSPPPEDRVFTTLGAAPRIARVGRGVGLGRIAITYDLALPVGLDDQRRARRAETVVCPLTVLLTLRDGSRRLEIDVTFANRARDHRLRFCFPTDLAGVDTAHASMQFDVQARPIAPEPIAYDDWWVEDPAATFPMHGWMDFSDGQGRGLCVAGQGIHEFAVSADERRAVALTLLRAVGYLGAGRDLTTILGGAGPHLATPEAQLQTTLHYRLALVPHAGNWHADEVWREAQAFLTPPRAVTSDSRAGARPPSAAGLRVAGQNAVLSAVKVAEDGGALIVRLFNPSDAPTTADLTLPFMPEAVHLADLAELPGEALVADGAHVAVPLPPRRIVTVRCAKPGA